MDSANFELRARTYCKQLGFPLGKIFIRSCDEQGDQAIVQLTLSNATGSANQRYREGVVLKREEKGWRVVLPGQFGQVR